MKYLTLLLALTFISCGNAVEKAKINKSSFTKVAIKGYDTVAYFTVSKALKGNKEFSHTWKEAKWRFSSKENLELFKASPEKYAPQYGGWCAWGLAAKDKLYGIEGNCWTIVDGKLYLNYNKSIQKNWEKEKSKFIKDANKLWPKDK